MTFCYILAEMRRSQSASTQRNEPLVEDQLPQDITLRKEAIQKRIKSAEEINNKISNCRRTLQEQLNQSQRKINGITNQGEVHRNALQQEIAFLEEQRNAIDEQIELKKSVLQSKPLQMQQDIAGEQWEMELEKQKINLEINGLQKHPKYMSAMQINELRHEFEQLKLIPISRSDPNLQQPTTDNQNCPICFNKPRECHECNICNNWVCQDCKGHLTQCPQCRADLGPNPLRRNKALEESYYQG